MHAVCRLLVVPLVLSTVAVPCIAQQAEEEVDVQETDEADARPAPPEPAGLEGHIYLRVGTGDTRAMSATEVRLVDARVPQTVQESCDSLRELVAMDATLKAAENQLYRETWEDGVGRRERRERRARFDSAQASHREWRESTNSARSESQRHIAEAVLLGSALATTTGIDGRFSFTGVPPGQYFLFTEAQLGRTGSYLWWVPAELGPGERLTIDLDNTNVSADDEVDARIYGAFRGMDFRIRSPLLAMKVCRIR